MNDISLSVPLITAVSEKAALRHFFPSIDRYVGSTVATGILCLWAACGGGRESNGKSDL